MVRFASNIGIISGNEGIWTGHVDFGCCAEGYQLNPQYRPLMGVSISVLTLIWIMLENWIQGGQLLHSPLLGMGHRSFPWKSKMQPTLANSSMAAEYVALRFGTCEILGLNRTGICEA